ncbi:MAG: ribosome small subunit-dependent GTPase A [Chlamydiales bacterium]|nr:ribosome small subunit-dependent GTPase A [Chlamydiales bacterium]
MSDNEYLLDFEERFHAKDRKIHKKERKLAQSKDKSKYKKTDTNKAKISLELSTNKTAEGRVLSISSEGIIVAIDSKEYLCSIRGSLKQERTKKKNLVTVGDLVLVQLIDQLHGVITTIQNRSSVLCRAENYYRKKQQLLAANVDQVLITCSPFLPSFKPTLIDRYVIMAQKGNMTPIVLINKIDYLEHPPAMIHNEEHAQVVFLINEFCNAYKKLNVLVLKISAKTNDGLHSLEEVMKGKISVFSGQSGVGKTSLINLLTGLDLKIATLRTQTQKGKHTTTSACLIPLQHGGYCVDTPGIKSFGLWDIPLEELLSFFPDLQAFAHRCKFPNCRHIHEPNCGVKNAVEKEKLSFLRYESYLSLYEDIKENHDLF